MYTSFPASVKRPDSVGAGFISCNWSTLQCCRGVDQQRAKMLIQTRAYTCEPYVPKIEFLFRMTGSATSLMCHHWWHINEVCRQTIEAGTAIEIIQFNLFNRCRDPPPDLGRWDFALHSARVLSAQINACEQMSSPSGRSSASMYSSIALLCK